MFRTYEPTRDRLVAVKVFRLDVTPEQSQSLADTLARAAEAGLFHPSIVEPLASGVEGTVAYRAEEYVAGESLDVAIRHYAPAPLDKALPFITQLAGAIDFARAAGIGHGALHLRDIFVTPDEVRAGGFGVVDALEAIGLRAPVRRPYSAPERIAGEPWDTRADVFSLAAIAYELLTARRSSGTGEQVGALEVEHAGPHAASVHAVLARAMADDPARRYPTALLFASALEAAARGAGAVESAGRATSVQQGAAPAAPAAVAAVVPIAVESTPAETPSAPAAPAASPDVEDVVADDAGRHDDIADERESDDAHAAILLRDTEEPVAGMLFDDEAIEDLALVPPPDEAFTDLEDFDDTTRRDVVADRRPAAAVAATDTIARGPQYRDVPLEHRLDERPEASRAGLPLVPLAMTLLVGLALGFAGGFALGSRTAAPVSQATTTSTGSPEPSTPVPAAARRKEAGKPYSEQTVAEPPATSPAVPGDAPAPNRPPAATPGRAPASGHIVVRSTPSNANVTINNLWRGRTPLTVDRLTFGAYSVRIVRRGYGVAREDVTLSAGDPARTLSFRLQPIAAAAPGRPGVSDRARPAQSSNFSGALYVDSRPRGAKVYIDGRLAGTTPARIPGVAIGSHVVRLELLDHRAWTKSVRVTADQEARVTGSLDRIQ